MDESNITFNSFSGLSRSLLNSPTYNEFDAAFAMADPTTTTTSYPTYTGPSTTSRASSSASPTPSHSHPHSPSSTSSESNAYLSFNTSRPSPSQKYPKSTTPTSTRQKRALQPHDQIMKRRSQNRAAQRSFRERQKEYVHDLEAQVEQLKSEIERLHENYQDLVKAFTAPRASVGQWATQGDLSPVSLDGMEFRAPMEVKQEEMGFSHGAGKDYPGLLYV